MQELEVKITHPDGKIGRKKVRIIRMWVDAGGQQLCLHTSGTYGYKDESPVKSPGEFSIIGDVRQRKLAQQWWRVKGERMSREFYQTQDKEIMRRNQEALMHPGDEDNTEMDMVLYKRRPAASRKKADFGEPYTWYEWFTARPDWWGHASGITLGEHTYERVDLEEIVADEGLDDEPTTAPEPGTDTGEGDAGEGDAGEGGKGEGGNPGHAQGSF